MEIGIWAHTAVSSLRSAIMLGRVKRLYEFGSRTRQNRVDCGILERHSGAT